MMRYRRTVRTTHRMYIACHPCSCNKTEVQKSLEGSIGMQSINREAIVKTKTNGEGILLCGTFRLLWVKQGRLECNQRSHIVKAHKSSIQTVWHFWDCISTANYHGQAKYIDFVFVTVSGTIRAPRKLNFLQMFILSRASQTQLSMLQVLQRTAIKRRCKMPMRFSTVSLFCDVE